VAVGTTTPITAGHPTVTTTTPATATTTSGSACKHRSLPVECSLRTVFLRRRLCPGCSSLFKKMNKRFMGFLDKILNCSFRIRPVCHQRY